MFSLIKKIKRMDNNSFCYVLIILSDYICLNPRTVYNNQETFEFCEISKSTFSYRTPPVAASEN